MGGYSLSLNESLGNEMLGFEVVFTGFQSGMRSIVGLPKPYPRFDVDIWRALIQHFVTHPLKRS